MANIEAIYPLTPMQQGMLFHTLYDPESGQYFEQFHYRLQGDVDTRMLRKAWQVLVDRHSVLRTAFRYDSDNPVQIVLKQAEVPWTEYDWREFTQEERLQKRDTLLEAERRRGFDFTQAPLMRFQIVQDAPDSWQILWHYHHALMDGWCLPILFGELLTVYASLSRGEAPRLLPVNHYRNYIAWLVEQDQQAAQDYWQKKLAGFTSPTAIPIIRQQGEQTPDYRDAAFTLSPEQSREIDRFAREQRVTVNTMVQAAWAILLARYSAEEDVVFGVTTSGRNVPVPGIETMVGLFLNTLPLRVRLEGVLPTLLHAIQEQQQQDNQFAHTGLVDIQEWTQVPGGVALFDSILVFENYPVGDALKNQENLPFRITDFQAIEYTNYPITLFVLPGESLAFKLTFDQNRIAPDAIDRLFGQLEVLLGAMVRDPGTDVCRLPILTEAERHRILVEWNDTQAPYPQDKCIHELFEEQVARSPDAVAVIFGDEEVSYGELNVRANQLAHRLRRLGVGPEVLVGLLNERSVEMVVGLLAILKAGGAYVPLDPEYPQERLAFMAEDADIEVLLCHGATRERLPECAARILDVDAESATVAGESAANPEPLARPEDLAYVIYTSGSTGKPKGVAMPHGALVNLLSWQRTQIHDKNKRVVLQFAPLSFDVSFQDILSTLYGGSTLVLAGDHARKDFALLIDHLIANNVDRIFLPFIALQTLASVSISVGKFPPLREVITAGEQLRTTKEIQEFFSALPDCVLYNQYGPTETHVVSSYTLEGSVSGWPELPPIGRSIANTQLYILDSWTRPVPIGVPGELYIGGVGVARGYLNRPDLTFDKFIPNPFSDDPDARLYRTGDLCRWLPDGNIEFLGRIDTQVKIRGFRIECGEVENLLLAYPDVREAVVDARGEGEEKQLVAWVCAARGNDADVGATGRSPLRDELRVHLRASLPDWMIPTRFVFVDTLPLTPSGKIDRRALPAPDESDLAGRTFVTPISPIEEMLSGLWAAVLKRETVGRFDNFFELGGHSLLATQLVSRIRDSLQVELPVRVVFEHPELSALAKAIEASSGLSHRLPPIEAQPADAPKSLSFAQQRLWFLERYVGRSSATYNMPAALRFSGPLDIHALQFSLQWMVERHESLRMVFPDREGMAYVEILSTSGFEFPIHDLRHLSPADQRLQQRIDENAARPFDLTRGPLFRAEILQLGEEGGETVHVLLLNMHHIVSDGWSIGVFAREWGEAYVAFARGESPQLAPLPIQYTDYAAWQRQWLEGEILEGQLAWWKENLHGITDRLELPTDYPRPTEQDYRGNHYSQTLPAEVTAALENFSRAQGVTLFMTLLATLDVLLAHYSGQDDICVGSPVANRTHTHTENLIGFFFNPLVLRTRLNPDQGFRALLQQVRRTCLGAYAHQDIPFETLVEELNPTRTLSHSPLFQIVLVLNAPVEMAWPGLAITTLEQDYPISKFDLTLYVEERNGQLHCLWEYATSLFTEQTIRRMGEHFEVLLRGIIAEPETPISRLHLLTEAERQRILVEWNDTAGPVSPALLHDLFIREAQRRPDAPAIIAPGRTLTYGELLDLARRTAHWLQRQELQRNNVAPNTLANTLVAVVMEKGWEQVAAVLGILMGGGAYLPIDAHLPAARRNNLLTDGAARLVLTQPKFSDLEWPDGTRRLVISEENLAKEAANVEEASVRETATDPEDLAYVIYTSGSTGKPKGVMIDHRGAVNTILDINRRFTVTEADRVLCLSALNFDLSVYDVFGVLAAGGVLVIPDEEGLRDPAHWRDLMAEHGITLWDTVPVLKQMLVEYLESHAEPIPPGMRLVMMSGDWIPLDLPGRIRALWPEVEIIGLGGATEASIWSNFHPIEDIDPDWKSIPYGKPLTNQFFRVLDSHLAPRPVRLPGDLYIGGIGLAKGYWNDPEKTAERFLTHPGTGERLYRTGDLGRYLPDGNLEFLGRSDFQVKIRGHRIELGEIEAVLTSHPGVKEAVVTALGEERDLQTLAAYVVPIDAGQSVDETSEEFEGKPLSAGCAPQPHAETSPMPDDGSKIDEWEHIYDHVYDQPMDSESDPKFNIAGWISSYTGGPIPREEMKEWLDGTVERILSHSPKRVLELGCGTGMLMFRIAPRCDTYMATDLSSKAVDYIEQHKKTWEFGERVKLLQRPADNFDGVEEGFHDAIILNSVTQHFPSVDYLITVLTGAVTALAPGGFIFIGDVRDFRLMEEFHASVQLHQADDSVSLAELKQRVRQGMEKDKELLIDPDFFIALTHFLPRITRVGIQLKSGHARNEMSCFRYDVTLYIDAESPMDRQFQRLDWQKDELTLEKVREILAEEQPEIIAFENIPNARLPVEKRVVEELVSARGTVGELRASIEQMGNAQTDNAQTDNAMEPGAFHALTRDLPYTSFLDYRGKYDYSVLFRHQDADTPPYFERSDDFSPKALHTYANTPLRGTEDDHELAPRLRDFLKEKLPDYMVPSLFVPLDCLPLTPSGKIDRRALPNPNAEDVAPTTGYVAPRTEPEIEMAGLWREVLGVGKIGLHNNFFDLGGHSLFAIQLVSQVKEHLGFDVSLRALFEAPTVAELLEKTAGLQRPDGAGEKPDLEAEARLDDDIRPQRKKIATSRIEDPRHVFITGATGFFGVYLVGELLRQTQATIWCLVRGKDEQEAEKRLTAALMAHAQVTGGWRDRVKVITGDLKQERLGLAEAVFLELARKIDIVYHNGAEVNHLYPYQELRKANVDGTKEVLRLACIERSKSMHYVSTLGVFSGTTKHPREDSKLEANGLVENGYTQSKWVSENLIWEANHRGLPVAVYRPTLISGHSKTGRWTDTDALYQILKATIGTGISPDGDYPQNLVPVDYCAKALIWLSRRKQTLGGAYHLVNPNPITWREIVDHLRANGLNVVDRSYEEWREAVRHSDGGLLGSWLDHMVGEGSSSPENETPIFECQRTLQALSGSGIECPKITTEIIGCYVASMQQEK